MSKVIAFKPKNKVELMAAMAASESAGRGRFKASSSYDCAIGTWVNFFTDETPSWGSMEHGAVAVASLDELVALLTAKPEKQPKQIGSIRVLGESRAQPGLLINGNLYKVTLHPDGAVQVGCSAVRGDDFKRIMKEYEAYHKEDGQ